MKYLILFLLSFSVFASVGEIELQIKSQKKNKVPCLFFSSLREEHVPLVNSYLLKINLQYFQQGQNIIISLSKEIDKEISQLKTNQKEVEKLLSAPRISDNASSNIVITKQLELLQRLISQCQLKN